MDSKPIQNMWILSIKFEVNEHKLYIDKRNYSYICYNLPKGRIQKSFGWFLIQKLWKRVNFGNDYKPFKISKKTQIKLLIERN